MTIEVKNMPANAGDSDLIPGSVKFLGGGHSKLHQYFCLENHMDRGAWKAMIHSVAKSLAGLK